MDDLISIGNFSRMSRLSIKALRLYDELGLLTPAWVDPSSGYRYYRAAQANPAEAIRILRMLDMPLDEIRELLAEDDPDTTTKRLAVHRERLAERVADQERMLRFLERLIERGGTVMPYDVTIKQVPAQHVASLTLHTDLERIGADIGHGFGTVVGAITAAATQPVGAPFIVSHDVIDEQTAGEIEICIPVPPDASASSGGDVASDGVVWKEIPAGTVASTTHRGPYSETVIPEDLLTEVQFPIADRE